MATVLRLCGQRVLLRHALVPLFTLRFSPSRLCPRTWPVAVRCAATEAPAAKDVAREGSNGAPAASSNGGAAAEKKAWKAAIDFKFLRDNVVAVEENVKLRKADADVRRVVELYDQFVKQSQAVDDLRAERKRLASSLSAKLEPDQREKLVAQGKDIRERLEGLEAELSQLTEEMQREGQRLPNLTHPSAPVGGEEVAAIRREVGSQREFTFPVKDHIDIGKALDLFDFETAAEVSGQKFYYLKNAAVLLELALINWALTKLVARGFTPLSTPDLVRSHVLERCGFQPRGENTQVYTVEDSDLCLAGTAEILCGGLVMERIIPEAELPMKLVALSHCFRTEAGAAGRENRGLYRVHQFTKVEMFVVSTQEQSEALHEELISIEEEMYSELGLHFKTLDMPSEDLGAPAYRKYDVEAWMPGLGKYGEVSSASNCTDYQARRLNIRYRPSLKTGDVEAALPKKGGKGKGNSPKKVPTEFVHTLNATACAVPRLLIAILENHQQEDGSVVVPEPLRPFMGGMEVIRS